MVFFWNPETNVSQYEHPNPPPPPPPPPHPPPDHYQFPFEYKPTFISSDLNYRPPDYPASYMTELPVPPSYTSPIFLPHLAQPSVMYSDSIDGPQIPHSYATNPNFHDPQIYSPSLSYERNPWVFESENNQISLYELDPRLDLTVHTSPKISLNSVRAKQKLAGVSHVRMKRKAPSVSFSQRRYRNPLIPSFSATPSFLSVRSSQAQEPTSPMHMGARMPIALQRRRGAETVALGDPAPSGQVLLHKKKMMTMLGHKWGRQVQGLKPFFHFRQRRAKWKLMYTGRLSRRSNKDIHNSDVVTLVGDQPWVQLSNLQSHAVKVFDGMPRRSIKVRMLNFLIFDLMEQFKSGLAINKYVSCVLKALRVVRMLSFPFDVGGVLRKFKIVGAVFNRIWQLTEIDIAIYYGLHDARYIGQVYSVQVIAYKVLTVATLVALVTVKDVVQIGNFDSADRLSSHPRSIYGGWSLYITNKLMVVVVSHYQAIVNVTGLSVCISFAIFDKQKCFIAPTSCINIANWSNISDHLWSTIVLRLVLVTARDTRSVCHISSYKSMVVAAAKKLGHYYDINLSSSNSLFKIVMHKFTQDPVWHACQHELNHGFIIGGNLYAKCGLTLIVLVSLLMSTRVLRISCAFFDISQESGKWRVAFEIMVTLLEDQVRCSVLCKKIIHDDGHISFILSHNEEVIPLLPMSLLGFSMDFMSMILWCGMRSLAVINDALNFFMVNSHLDHAKLLKALIRIKLLDENWQEKSEATPGNTIVTGMVFPLHACRILTLPHVKRTLSTASWDWVMKFCIRDDFVGVPLSRDWKYVVLGSSSWSKECAVDRQKSVVAHSSCFGASSSLQNLLHHAHKIPEDKFPKLAIDFELSSSNIHAKLLTSSAVVYQGPTETEGMKNDLFHFFTSAIQHSKSTIRFFTDDILAFLILNSMSACSRKVLLIATWNHGDNDAVNFKCILVVPSTVPHDLFGNYCKTNQPNLMWHAIVLISAFSNNNGQRYDSNLLKETKAISQALIHGITASLTIPMYGLMVGSYRHIVDLQYLIGCITRLKTWWQGQSLNSKLIPHTSDIPTAKYLRRVEVFNGFVKSYFPYYFWTSNLLTEHDAKAFEDEQQTRILLARSPGMLLAMKWVVYLQLAPSLAIFNAIFLPQELVVGDATKPIVLLLNAVKLSLLSLFYLISKYLAKLHDFILAGYELMIFVFWVNTLKKLWKDMVRDLKTIQKLIPYEYGTPLDNLAGLFP